MEIHRQIQLCKRVQKQTTKLHTIMSITTKSIGRRKTLPKNSQFNA